MTEETNKDETEKSLQPVSLQDGSIVPKTLVGSGTTMVKVRANAGAMGLQSGQISTLEKSEEVSLNIANGNLSLVED